MNTFTKCVSFTTLTAVMIFSTMFHLPITAQAKEQSIKLKRATYEFDDKSTYDIDSAKTTSSTEASITLGTLTLNGDINSISKKGTYDSYEIADKSVFSLEFKYDSALSSTAETDWHLISDSKKEVAGSKLDSKIKNGAIILQTSLDGEKWTKAAVVTDLSGDVTFDANNGINDVQLINGCYYRVISAFEISKKSPGQFNIFDVFNNSASYIEKLKCAEVYRFYAGYADAVNNVVDGKYHKYETKEFLSRTKKNDYAGSETIDKNDPHYGWPLGSFCINGYSDAENDGDIYTYYKTVGDKITLSFQLDKNVDIEKLDGNANLKITNDKNGCDSILGTKPHAMEHGELIVKHTKTTGETQIVEYSNFLEALSSPGANTIIRLYEEGDYVVHLDYGITNDKAINKNTYYRVDFSFKISNGNTMGFLFDTLKGNELSDGDTTPNGFRLDDANNRNIKFNVKRRDFSSNGKTLDVRFDKVASGNDKFIEQGVYEIKISSRTLPDEYITKTIFVGSDELVAKYKKVLSTSTIQPGTPQETPAALSTTTVSQKSTTKPSTTASQKTTTKPTTTASQKATTKPTTTASQKAPTKSTTTTARSSTSTKTQTTLTTTTKTTARPQTQTTTKP